MKRTYQSVQDFIHDRVNAIAPNHTESVLGVLVQRTQQGFSVNRGPIEPELSKAAYRVFEAVVAPKINP